MLKKASLFFTTFLCAMLLLPSTSNAINLLESFFLKITVVENGVEYQWEYTSPGKYEYEKGNEVIKTKEAKEEMQKIIKTLKLSEKAKIEEMVKSVKQNGFSELERLDIRWMNGESKLYTWVWENEN